MRTTRVRVNREKAVIKIVGEKKTKTRFSLNTYLPN